mmetsp:Transcript_34851/g.70503  ORF Transcript_34851/g.70503 Transcript_34851/m.70503 type:complete len:81 (+) Transcript_34851:1363-1605(+)
MFVDILKFTCQGIHQSQAAASVADTNYSSTTDSSRGPSSSSVSFPVPSSSNRQRASITTQNYDPADYDPAELSIVIMIHP